MTVGPGSIPVGFEESFYAAAESTFNTFTKPAATDAIRIKSSSFTPAQERVTRSDKRGSRSRSERITRKKSAEWSITMYMNPSGSAGVAPDEGNLIKALFGTEAIVGSTSATYSCAKDINLSFSLHRRFGDYAESISGAVVNQGVFRVRGEEECEVELSGMGADYVYTAPCTLAASSASGANTVTITNAEDYITANSVVQIGTLTNAGAGYKVASISSNTVTLETTLSADVASGASVVSYFPAAITTGSPLGCFPGTVTFATNAVYVTEFEVTVNNNLGMQNDLFGYEVAQGYFATNFREVTFTGSGYVQTEHAPYRGKSEQFDQIAMVITIGNTAGRRVVITMPYAELNIVPYEVPESEQCTLTFEGDALASSAGEDEITLAYT